MDDDSLDLWQKEAARFESAVHLNMTRTYAFAGIGLTGMGTAIVGTFVSQRVEVVLLVPLILLALLPIILNGLQEVLVKALYQFNAEREIARLLAKRATPQAYPTWEDIGGRIGNESRTTSVSWIALLVVSCFLGVGSLAYFVYRGGVSRLFPITEHNVFLTVAIIVAAAGSCALLIAVVVSFLRMFDRYKQIKTAFGYSETQTIAQALAQMQGLVPHPQTTVDGDDRA